MNASVESLQLTEPELRPWWLRGVLGVMAFGCAVLIAMTMLVHAGKPGAGRDGSALLRLAG